MTTTYYTPDPLEIRDTIDDAAEHIRDTMPAEVRRTLALVLADLHDGPVYLDSDGDRCCHADTGARQFDMAAACDALADWADDAVSDVSVEVAFDDDTGESVFERVDGSAEIIRRAIFGDAAEYIR